MDAQTAGNIRALIVEDSDDMRDLMKLLLEEAGYETLTAADGRAALKQIENDRECIDLVITDVQMPEVTGHEILAAVRARRKCLTWIARRFTVKSKNVAKRD